MTSSGAAGVFPGVLDSCWNTYIRNQVGVLGEEIHNCYLVC